MSKIWSLAISTLVLTGCMSTKLTMSEKWNPREKPSYVDNFDYYWWGLAGEPEIQLQKVCMDQKIHAVQRIKSAEDIVITGITLGIYSPVSVKVWCGE